MARNFSNWLQAYMQHTRFLESPDGFHFWTGVGAIAGALRRKVWIPMLDFTWTPNFYIILVGPPGVAAKSTSMRVGINLLRQVEGVHFGPSSATWHGLGEVMQNAQEHVHIPGQADPLVQSCITLAISELGTFLRPDNGEMMDNLTDWWDGQDPIWYRKTKSSGDTVIHNPWINLIACTTPAWLKANFPEVMIGGGLTSRMIFVYGYKKRQLVAYPTQLVKPSEHEREAAMLAADLKGIGALAGPFALTDDALRYGTQWYEQHWNAPRPAHLLGDRFGGYIARKQTHIHKLAIVLSAAESDKLVITEDHLRTAVSLIDSTEQDLKTVFDNVGIDEDARHNISVLDEIKAHQKIEYQRLWELCFARMPNRAFVDAMKAVLEAGHATVVTENGKRYILAAKTRKDVPHA